MRSFKLLAVVVAAGFSVCAQAWVTIIDTGPAHYAGGQIRSASPAGRENAYIYCDLDGGNMTCGASDGVSKYAWCYTNDPNFTRMFASIGETSEVQFFWNDDGTCGRLDVDNSSVIAGGPNGPGALHYVTPVYASPSGHYAYGTINDSHSSLETNVGIQCMQTSYGLVQCVAMDSAGNFGSCYLSTDGPGLTLAQARETVAGVNESSYVYFRWDDSPDPHCTEIYVANASFYGS